jgi:hypothetical protein
MSTPENLPATETGAQDAVRLVRGIRRTFAALGYGTLAEFTLANGRRADLIGVNAAGEVALVEIKTSAADFRADEKWPEYLPYCDSFYFAVPEEFPRHLLPADCGLIIADAYAGVILRPAPPLSTMNAARRRALLIRFALAATSRLQRLLDPEVEV